MSVLYGGILLILPLAALANPFAERAKAPAPCQQSHQAQRSPTATSSVEGARARAGPSIRVLLSSCAHQHRQRMPVALQGARKGRAGARLAAGPTGMLLVGANKWSMLHHLHPALPAPRVPVLEGN